MKLKCTNNTYKEGFISKTEKRVSLTINKEYDAQAVPIVSNWFNYTEIDKSSIKFLVFNDLGEWQVYDKSFFAPA